MRDSTRTVVAGWAVALLVALVAVAVAVVRNDDTTEPTAPAASGPRVPSDVGDGCGEAAATDPADLSVGRVLARCGAGAPEPEPLAAPASVRVAVAERNESAAPLLVADALGEFDAENLAVDIVEMSQGEAYDAMAVGEVDVVVGDVDGAFFDAVHDGLGARLVLGGPVARAPNDLGETQAGLWLRADLISADGDWDNLEGQAVVLPGGIGSAALYPIDTLLRQHALDPNLIDIQPGTSRESADRLHHAAIGGAWLTEPTASGVAGDRALRLVATSPGSESLQGTVFAPRLLAADRAVGLAYARAVVRTINTHLADRYTDEARAALVEALDMGDGEDVDGPGPLFDWELRSGTTARIQRALVTVGGIGYERPVSERRLIDRSIAADVVGAP